MDSIFEESLRLHREHHGKLSIESKVPIKNRADLSRVYTPGVGQVSVEIGKDKRLAREYTIKRNAVAVVSDGSAILGLGNLGAYAAIPVMEGKAALFKTFAGIDAFPICLATQNVDEIVETVERIAPVFGGINLEDIAAPRCFEIERRLKETLDIPVVHDDQHGTAVVVLAALINALRVSSHQYIGSGGTRGAEVRAIRIVISGAAAAGTAVTKLLLRYGFHDIVVCDSKGILSSERTDLTPYKAELARATNPRRLRGDFAQAIRGAHVLVGVSRGNIVSQDAVRSMHSSPIVFALANPIPEIMPDDAKRAGAAIVATGRSDFPNQINNVLAFPGIFRGALDNGVREVTEAMLMEAAKRLAECVPHPTTEAIMPDVFDPRVVQAVASAIR